MTGPDGTAATTLVDRLYAIAEGSTATEAAVMILTEAVNGHLLDTVSGFITDWPERGRAAVDWEALAAATGPMSGGERRLIALAASLASTEVTVNLNDAVSGLDHANSEIVCAAVAHALGVRPWGSTDESVAGRGPVGVGGQ